GRLACRVAREQRRGQGPLDRPSAVTGALDGRQRRPGGVERPAERGGALAREERLPRLVVVAAGGVGDAPVAHGAVLVGRHGALEAADSLVVVVPVAPRQAAVEPALGLRRARAHGTRVAPEVEGVVVGGACQDLLHSRPPDALSEEQMLHEPGARPEARPARGPGAPARPSPDAGPGRPRGPRLTRAFCSSQALRDATSRLTRGATSVPSSSIARSMS